MDKIKCSQNSDKFDKSYEFVKTPFFFFVVFFFLFEKKNLLYFPRFFVWFTLLHVKTIITYNTHLL